MAKISRPIVYVALLGVAAYAYVLVTEPAPTPKKVSARKSAGSSATPAGFTAEDLKASFPRYARRGADAFAPRVIGKKGAALSATSPTATSVAAWTLTGITLIDGVKSALLEQAGTGETVFVTVGQVWNALTVQAIEPAAVVFVDKGGKTIRLAFPEPAEASAVAPVTLTAASGQPAPLATGLPAQSGAATIPPPGNAPRTTR